MKRWIRGIRIGVFAAMMFCLVGVQAQASSYYNTGLQAYTNGTKKDSSVALKWEKIANASYYVVERRSKSGGSWGEYVTVCKKVKSTGYTDKTAKVNHAYEYRVTAMVKTGTGKKVSIKIMTKKPRVLILDSSGRKDPVRVGKYLKNAGFSVKVVKDKVKVNTRSDVMVEDYDALVLPGGYSVNPSCYGGKVTNSHSHFGTLTNDKIQIDAVLKFKKAGKPVLGICRGSQVVNVALGGTIKQCIGKAHTHYLGKYRNVKIKKQSFLYGVFGSSEKTLHSHHQAVAKLGENLVVTEWDAKDKTIEAFESTTDPIFGLQWHPDDFKSKASKKFKDKTGLAAFRAFRSVCQTVLAQ